MNTTRSQRAGFTLIELLVVIAIIGVLVGLLLPAVQAARESARRTACVNNVKQMALALMNYHDVEKQFPRGLVCTTGSCDLTGNYDGRFAARSADWGESFTMRALPFMEFQSIYDDYDFAEPNSSLGNMEAVMPNLSTLLCPSREPVSTYLYIHPTNSHRRQVSRIHYGGNYGAGRAISETLSVQPGLRGVFNAAEQWGAEIKDITDGTSKTLLLGEIITDSQQGGDSRGAWNYQAGTAFSGGLTTATPSVADIQAGMRTPNVIFTSATRGELGDHTPQCPNRRPDSDTTYYCNDGSKGVAVRSTHPGGAIVAMADGSSRFVNDAIDKLVWYGLHTIGGGETIGQW